MADTNTPTVEKKTTKKASTKPADTQATDQVEGSYSITTKKDGFRRAGREWSGTTTVAPDELTAKQLDMLNADPMFVVVKL